LNENIRVERLKVTENHLFGFGGLHGVLPCYRHPLVERNNRKVDASPQRRTQADRLSYLLFLVRIDEIGKLEWSNLYVDISDHRTYFNRTAQSRKVKRYKLAEFEGLPKNPR
jgi:hypothetical protein